MEEEDRSSGRTLELVSAARAQAWALDVQDDETVRRVLLSADPIVLGMHRGELFLRCPPYDWAELDDLPRGDD